MTINRRAARVFSLSSSGGERRQLSEVIASYPITPSSAMGDPSDARRLLDRAQQEVGARWRHYQQLAATPVSGNEEGETHASD